MTMYRFCSHTVVPHSLRRRRRNIVQRAIRIPNRWLLLAFAIMSCSLLMGFGLPRLFSQARSADSVKTTAVIEIQYVHPEASEVFVVWGINGWQAVPEELRPAGTTFTDNGLMQTPLNLDAGVFTGRLLVPTWSSLDYGFMIYATKDGREVAIWDGRDEFELRVGETDRTIDVMSSVDLNPEQTSSGAEAEE
jgi:hypothetical protein